MLSFYYLIYVISYSKLLIFLFCLVLNYSWMSVVYFKMFYFARAILCAHFFVKWNPVVFFFNLKKKQEKFLSSVDRFLQFLAFDPTLWVLPLPFVFDLRARVCMCCVCCLWLCMFFCTNLFRFRKSCIWRCVYNGWEFFAFISLRFCLFVFFLICFDYFRVLFLFFNLYSG